MSQIVDVQPIPIRIPNPHSVEKSGRPPGEEDLPGSVYHRKPHRGLVYTRHRETLFIKIIADDGTVGWGETLASVAPQIAAQVVESAMRLQGPDHLLERGFLRDQMPDAGSDIRGRQRIDEAARARLADPSVDLTTLAA